MLRNFSSGNDCYTVRNLFILSFMYLHIFRAPFEWKQKTDYPLWPSYLQDSPWQVYRGLLKEVISSFSGRYTMFRQIPVLSNVLQGIDSALPYIFLFLATFPAGNIGELLTVSFAEADVVSVRSRITVLATANLRRPATLGWLCGMGMADAIFYLEPRGSK